MGTPRWEYLEVAVKGSEVTVNRGRDVHLDRINFERYANELGSQGWELAGIAGALGGYTAIFKRPRPESG